MVREVARSQAARTAGLHEKTKKKAPNAHADVAHTYGSQTITRASDRNSATQLPIFSLVPNDTSHRDSSN